MRRLQLENRTGWRTADVRAIVNVVAAEELRPGQKPHMHIVVFHKNAKGARDDRYTSRRRAGDSQAAARVGLKYNAFHVTLPKIDDGAPAARIERVVEWARAYLATQLAHEFAECRGKAHADLKGTTRYGYRVKGRPYGDYWQRTLADTPLRWGEPPAAPKPAPSPEAIAAAVVREHEKRLAHAEAKVAMWERRQKLAGTHLTKWKRRVAARQRALAKRKEHAA